MSKKPITIYFDDKSNLVGKLHYYMITNPAHYNYKSEIAKNFTDHLDYVKIHDYHDHRSRVLFRSRTSGREYTMLVKDFHDVIINNKFIANEVLGEFEFVKRGNAQSIKLVIENSAP